MDARKRFGRPGSPIPIGSFASNASPTPHYRLGSALVISRRTRPASLGQDEAEIPDGHGDRRAVARSTLELSRRNWRSARWRMSSGSATA
jgi:hypothetical protein